jgi:hypothetical protein
MAVASKPGGGGHNESYDTETGKYTKTGSWNKKTYDKDDLVSTMDDELLEIYNSLDEEQKEDFLSDYEKSLLIEDNKYEEDLDFSQKDLQKLLESGNFDDELLEIYNSLNETEKQEFLNDLYSEIVNEQTQNTLNERFDGFNMNEYKQMYTDCLKVLQQNGVTQRDLDAFYDEYRGAGSMSFEFNKALRMGFAEFYKQYPQFRNSGMLSQQAIMDRAARMDKLTRSYEMPRDGMVFRYLDENYLVSTFEKFGVLDDFDIYTDPMYKYQTIDRRKYTVQQLYEALQPLIGGTVDGDGGFTSFSTVKGNTHMGKHSSPYDYKRIQIKFDVPKGTKCFVSNYGYESEGLFPRETKYFIKDIKLEKDEQGLERVVMYYGVQQDF